MRSHMFIIICLFLSGCTILKSYYTYQHFSGQIFDENSKAIGNASIAVKYRHNDHYEKFINCGTLDTTFPILINKWQPVGYVIDSFNSDSAGKYNIKISDYILNNSIEAGIKNPKYSLIYLHFSKEGYKDTSLIVSLHCEKVNKKLEKVILKKEREKTK